MNKDVETGPGSPNESRMDKARNSPMSRRPTIGFIAPLPSLALRVRMTKMATLFLAHGHRLAFAGWERLPGEAAQNPWPGDGVDERLLFRGGGYARTVTRLLYPIWMIRVFLHVLLGRRPDTLFCLGWETAFPALLASFVRPATIVFDDADRFSMIVQLPSALHRVVTRLEEWTSRRVAMHIVPGYSRYEWRHERMVVLRNTPVSSDFRWAEQHARPRPDADLVVYVNGWISRERGADVVMEAADQYLSSGRSLAILAAGQATDSSGEALLRHPAALDFGRLQQAEALALYAAADVTLTFYDPSVAVNRRAEPNKWGDAVFFGKPFIVNQEVETASSFIDRGIAFAVPFGDPDALARLWRELADDPQRLESARAAALAARSEFEPFEEQLSSLLQKLEERSGCRP